jgi:integrase
VFFHQFNFRNMADELPLFRFVKHSSQNPTQGVQLPRQQSREMRVLNTEQARAFLRIAVPTPHGCIFALALTTGMRPSEYLALCWQDIDWEHGTVSVVRTLQRNEGQWRFSETKRVRSRRVVKLQTWVLNLLKELRYEAIQGTHKEERDGAFSELIYSFAPCCSSFLPSDSRPMEISTAWSSIRPVEYCRR